MRHLSEWRRTHRASSDDEIELLTAWAMRDYDLPEEDALNLAAYTVGRELT